MLKGREYNRNKATEGFDEVNDPRIARAVHQGGYADVLLRPTMVGILRCGKMLPPQLNLVIEIEFADATTALWSENAGAHPSGATLSTDFRTSKPPRSSWTLRWLSPSTACSSQEGRSCSATPRCTRSSPASRTESRSTTSPWRAPSLGAFVTFWDNDAGSKIHLLANPGQDVAPIGAARQEDMQYPHNPMKGASEHFNFLSVLAGTYDDTVRNIDIGRVGYCATASSPAFRRSACPRCH